MARVLALALVLALAGSAAAREDHGDANSGFARNPYIRGVVVSTNDPTNPGPGVIEGGVTKPWPPVEAEAAAATATGAASSHFVVEEDAEAPLTPHEDAIEADPAVQEARERYEAAQAKAGPAPVEPCCDGGAPVESEEVLLARVKLARARQAAHERLSASSR